MLATAASVDFEAGRPWLDEDGHERCFSTALGRQVESKLDPARFEDLGCFVEGALDDFVTQVGAGDHVNGNAQDHRCRRSCRKDERVTKPEHRWTKG